MLEMNTPGVSLFQGTESIKINSDLERAEEEEELEDQRRRNEELGNLLQNAFDDLEDDDVTVDSTTGLHQDSFEENVPRNYPQDGGNYQQDKAFKINLETYETEIHNLKMLLESRTNELENIKKIAKEDFGKKDELQKRLLITEAELERALAAKTNTHELLVESKEKCSNLENTISKLKNDKKSLELENNTILGKLETSQALLADVQRKYDMVERDLNRNNDRNFEMKRKQMEDRHRAEIEVMQQQIEQIDEKLRKKENELESMNTRYQALQCTHDAMLIDKGTKINDLNHALSEAQNKCEELLQREDYYQENVRLQKLVASLQQQMQHLEETIAVLNEKLEQTTAEIDQMDTLLHQHNLEVSPSRLCSTQSKLIGSTPLNAGDKMSSLKDELYRALANVKSKREEVKKLQQIIEEKNLEIRHLKDEENKALVEISTLKEDKIRLENRLKITEEDLREAQEGQQKGNQYHQKVEALNKEMKKLLDEKGSLQKDYKKTSDSLAQAEQKVKQLDAQLKNVQVDLEELKQEHESMKLSYEQTVQENKTLRKKDGEEKLRLDLEKHKFLLKDSQAECERLKNLYVEISNAKEALSSDFEKLKKSDSSRELQELNDKVASLQRALQLAEMKCSELSKLLETEKLCHHRELSSLREKLEKEKANEIEKAKASSTNCSKCLDYRSDITKFEIQNLQLANLNSIKEKEIEELQNDIKESKDLIAQLSEKLTISEQQQHLIKELKDKAHEFEAYIKSHTPSSSKASPKTPSDSCKMSDKSVETSPELEKNKVKQIEAQIREEMAKLFAKELKKFKTQSKDLEEKYYCLQSEYEHVANEMNQRETEVNLLKEVILAERENLTDLLKEKEEQCQAQIQSAHNSLKKAQEEIQNKNKNLLEAKKELDERQKQIEAERQSMKAVMAQWEAQRKNIDEVEAEWQQKLKDLEKTYESAMVAWQSKYNSAKLTARNYKRYAEDKEAHMLKEYDRIKMEYNANLTKLEVRLHEELAKRDNEYRERMAALERKRKKIEGNKENKENHVVNN